ncbi:MAG: phosphatidylserine/phosphatidylglycerophosphate/cardiolipin synthase family protein [Sphingomonas bacterium]|nr:phosphatidylserine/phosphatidylglycerophosphate/cardiolipin synthase family protein [Sphingomonas bacterium]
MHRPPAPAFSRTVTIDGNQLTFYPDGPDRLAALLELIGSARKSLRLLYYIFAPDRSGELVREALIDAINRGVEVALLIDGFGSSKTPENYFQELSDAGAHFCRFLPTLGRRYLIRNHQKLALADGHKVLIGGFNVEDDYFKPADDGGWRDIGLMVEGPAAARLMPYFDALMDWAITKRSKIRDLRALIHRFSETSGKLQWQYGGPMERLSPWVKSTCRDLSHSRDVEMIAAYFAPPAGMLRRIARVGRTGRARIITAAKSDNIATIAAARFTYSRLLKRGVRVFEYQRSKLHSKLLVLDDVAHVGSSNFDYRSIYLNLEMMLRVEDPEFTSLMRLYFEGELEACVEITPELHAQRSTLLNRGKWALSFFVVSLADYTVTRRLNFGGE